MNIKNTWTKCFVWVAVSFAASAAPAFESFDLIAAYNYPIASSNGLGTTRSGGTKEIFQIGEASIDSGNYRACYGFNPTAEQRTRIARARSVSLHLALSSRNAAATFDVDLYGLQAETAIPPAVSSFEKSGLLMAESVFTPSTPSGTYAAMDVTSFAKAEAARSGASLIVFRVQLDPGGPADIPLTNSAWDAYIVGMKASPTLFPYLRVVPYDATLVTIY